MVALVALSACSGGGHDFEILGDELEQRRFSDTDGWLIEVRSTSGERVEFVVHCVVDVGEPLTGVDIHLAVGGDGRVRTFDLARTYHEQFAGGLLLEALHSCDARQTS